MTKKLGRKLGKLTLVSDREPEMRIIKVICTVCTKEREIMTEHDALEGFVCTPCLLAKKNEGKVIKTIDGAPRGYVKGTNNPCKN